MVTIKVIAHPVRESRQFFKKIGLSKLDLGFFFTLVVLKATNS
jgi:hypothetical protein